MTQATDTSYGRSELQALIAAAKAATPGPWFASDWNEDDGSTETTIEARSTEVLSVGQTGIWPGGIQKHMIASTDEADDNNLANAAFISLANPSTVKAMAEELMALREAVSTILPYLRWTISDESPGHQPTMPSAVAVVEAAAKIGGSTP